MRDSVEDSIILFSRAGEMLRKVKDEYKKSSEEGAVSAALRIAIRDYLGDVRSSLDYLAWDIFTEKCEGNIASNKVERVKKLINFPIFDTKDTFDSKMAERFNGLTPEIISVLESVQSYQDPSGISWLKLLQELNNENKHRNLSRQKKRTLQNISDLHYKGPKGNITITNSTTDIEDVELLQILIGAPITDRELKEHPDVLAYDADVEVHLLFRDLDMPVIDTLEEIHCGASDVLNRLHALI